MLTLSNEFDITKCLDYFYIMYMKKILPTTFQMYTDLNEQVKVLFYITIYMELGTSQNPKQFF